MLGCVLLPVCSPSYLCLVAQNFSLGWFLWLAMSLGNPRTFVVGTEPLPGDVIDLAFDHVFRDPILYVLVSALHYCAPVHLVVRAGLAVPASRRLFAGIDENDWTTCALERCVSGLPYVYFEHRVLAGCGRACVQRWQPAVDSRSIPLQELPA
jgi:hypothetical protein